MTKVPNKNKDAQFSSRRQQAGIEVKKLDTKSMQDEPERDKFFNTVYDRANEDTAQIPWADLAPKPQLSRWLKNNPGDGKSALDIACGLGDNAEEISDAGYRTTAFDLADTAISWARQRFPQSSVTYQTANLFEPPKDWLSSFDLVNEVYTLQALPPKMLEKSTLAIARLVKPGGTLLVYTRLRPDENVPEGPPWPLRRDDAMKFSELGFDLVAEEQFELTRADRKIPHQFAHWHKKL